MSGCEWTVNHRCGILFVWGQLSLLSLPSLRQEDCSGGWGQADCWGQSGPGLHPGAGDRVRSTAPQTKPKILIRRHRLARGMSSAPFMAPHEPSLRAGAGAGPLLHWIGLFGRVSWMQRGMRVRCPGAGAPAEGSGSSQLSPSASWAGAALEGQCPGLCCTLGAVLLLNPRGAFEMP